MAELIGTYKDAVKIRTKKLVNGSESIYLDIYVDGKRKYEYLKLYLLPGKENRMKNKETLALANAVKSKRMVEIQNGRFGFTRNDAEDMLLVDFLDDYLKEKFMKRTEGYAKDIETVVNHVKKYIGNKKVKLKNVDKDFCSGFIGYLEKVKTKTGNPLGKGTLYSYFTIFVVALNKAVQLELIMKNPCDLIAHEDKPKTKPSERCYLTINEVKALIETSQKDNRVKNAFLFSCFTGLRFSDISQLRWENVKEVEEGVYQLEFVQQKTKQPVVVPLNANAMQWLPNRGCKPDDNIFELQHHSVVQRMLKKWVWKAGIEKHVTFHVARHTYATMLLHYGADIYTVSKLLGHTNINTTQIYAKVMDESKRKAVNLIPEI